MTFRRPGNPIFPFSVWTRLMRTVILEKGNAMLARCPRVVLRTYSRLSPRT